MNCHFDCCHVGLSPPIKTVQNLNKVFFTVLHCHRIGLFGLYHFEIPRIVNNIQLMRNIFEQIKYLANVDVEAKSILGVRHGSGLCILVIDFPRGVFRIFHHLNAFLIHINIIISDSKFNCSFMQKSKSKTLRSQKSFRQLIDTFVSTKPNKERKLSTFLKQHSQQQYPNNKISLVQKGIVEIDWFPFQMSNNLNRITKLYLSNNLINSLQNICQFSELQVLSLTNNQLTHLPTLRHLSLLTKLNNLGLQGNAICKHTLYLPYICGVTKGNLKTLDHQSLSSASISNGMECWRVYEDNMKQLLVNYCKLMHLLKMYKWKTIHNAIKEAGRHFEQRQEYTVNYDSFLQQIEQGIQYMPISFLITIQTILYKDIQALSDPNKKGYEGIGVAMYRLLSKQQDKMDELIEQIKGNLSGKDKENMQDIVFMMEGARVGKSKEKLYAEWKILQKYYKKLKGYRDRRIRKKGSSEQISEILRVSLSRNVVHVLGRLKACNKHDGLMNMMTIFYKYKRILMRKGLDSLLQNRRSKQRIEQVQKLVESRRIKKNIFYEWKKIYKFGEMQSKNKKLQEEVEEYKSKQQKYLNKIKLLQQLLQIMQNNQKQKIQPLSLLTDMPNSFHTSSSKSVYREDVVLGSPSYQYKSPSPKAIRKNVGGKQNMKNRQNEFVQRKFNSSRKTLKIEKQNLF